MASTYTANQGIEKMDTGDQSGTWGGTVNTNMDIIDRAISGVGALTLTGSTTTLTTTDGTLTDGMYRVLVLGDSGSDLGSDNTITLSPNDQDKAYLVYNNLSANRNAIFSQGTGANATVQNGETAWIYADGAGSGAAVRTAVSSVKITDQDGDTQIQVEEGGDDDDTIRFDIAGAEDFTMTANTFNVLSGSTLDVNSGATITNNGTATGFGADAERAVAGVLETNANFVDQAIFGPSVDGQAWNGKWSVASLYSSLMLVTIEDAGSDTQVNIWDLTEQSGGAPSTTPLGTVTLSGDATPTSVAACMGYIICGSEDGISIIDPHGGSWAERTTGYPKSLSTSTSPALPVNTVNAVGAGLNRQPAFDPRTGGPLPTFAVSYSGGSSAFSIIKDDGNVFDRGGTGHNAVLNDGRLFVNLGNVLYFNSTIETITADTPQLAEVAQAGSADNLGFNANVDDGLSVVGNKLAYASTSGLTISNLNENIKAGGEGITPTNAMITRTYNTGVFAKSSVGIWLANSKTTDRSAHSNTLTENGTVTEAAVETSAELMGYSGFSASNVLVRASDSNWDVVGTGSLSVAFWVKVSSSGGTPYLLSIANSGNSIRFNTYLSSGIVQFQVDGATATDNMAGISNIADNLWHRVDVVQASSTERYIYVDGVLEKTSTTDTGSLSDSGNLPLGIGANADGSTDPASNGTLALVRLSTTVPTATQIRQMYDAEKPMFVASAECLLQSGSTDAVLDVDVDPLTGKVLVTQTDAITIFDGLAVDSKPTVNSGSSEKGKLWGALRAEQNSANAYVTAPATDQRQVNEMVRGMASELPKGVDLSKAKAWVYFVGTGTIAFKASYNVKSITDLATGRYRVDFAVPFKDANYAWFAMGASGTRNLVDSNFPGYLRVKTQNFSGTDTDDTWVFVVAYGELENE